jgi:hypothetical protein
MVEMKIKTRERAATESVADADAVGGQSAKPANKVIKLGAKERLNSYVTPEQKRKLRLLAISRNCSISEIVGVLTDEAEAPVL